MRRQWVDERGVTCAWGEESVGTAFGPLPRRVQLECRRLMHGALSGRGVLPLRAVAIV